MEFGGCIPRETCLGRKKYNFSDIWFLNTGRSAIFAALLDSKCTNILLPYYTCPTIKQFLEDRGINVREYNIDNNFIPIVESLKENELIVWTNYYGCMKKETTEQVVKIFGKRLIVDNCQAFFPKPIDGVSYSVYSPRKFIGIACGGALYRDGLSENSQIINNWKFATPNEDYLDVALKYGSNAAYEAYSLNEDGFRKFNERMPERMVNTLMSVDFSTIRNRRKENFEVLHEAFGESSELNITYNSSQAFVFPLYTDDLGLRERLVENGVFCSTWWRRVLSIADTNSFEKKLVNHLIPLPFDHRYSVEDMKRMVETIKSLM